MKIKRVDFVTVVTIPKDRLNKIDFAACRQPAETLESFYSRQAHKPDLLINGGFFDMPTGRTIFNYIDNGVNIARDSRNKTGMAILSDGSLEYGNVDDFSNIVDFVAAHPPLVADGVITSLASASGVSGRARRTAVGYDSTHIYILTADSPGVTLAEWQEVVAAVGVDYAVNLDGGGSTRMLHKGKLVTDPGWSRPVDNVIGFWLKEEKKVLYRVQTGAFSKKNNAEVAKMHLDTLPSGIGMDYAKSYVRFVDGLYKIQIGAFSERKNAERVVADLKAHGVASFITTK